MLKNFVISRENYFVYLYSSNRLENILKKYRTKIIYFFLNELVNSSVYFKLLSFPQKVVNDS